MSRTQNNFQAIHRSSRKRTGGTVVAFLLVLAMVFLIGCAGVLLYNELTRTRQLIIEQASDLRRSIEDRTSDISRVLSKEASPAGDSAAVDTRRAAAGLRALDLGHKCLSEQKTDEALLYFINGVNHDPSNMKLISALAHTASLSRNPDVVARANGILELATVQVAPDDVATVLGLLASLREPPPIERATESKTSSEEAIRVAEELERRLKADVAWKDVATITKGLSDIQLAQEGVEASLGTTGDPRYTDLSNRLNRLTDDLVRLQAASSQMAHIRACIAALNKELASDSPSTRAFASIYASAQSVLAQLWGSSGQLPDEMQDSIRALAGQCEEAEASLQKKMSAGPIERIHQLASTAKDKETHLQENSRRHDAELKKRIEELTGQPMASPRLPGGLFASPLMVGPDPATLSTATLAIYAVHMIAENRLKADVRQRVAEAVADSFKNRFKMTPVIDAYVEAIEKASSQIDGILSQEGRQEAIGVMRDMREAVSRLELQRRVAYNQWALSCVNGFMVDWDSRSLISNEDAEALFGRYHIAEVDETLITPEVGRVLGRVMTCMTGELPVTRGSAIEHLMAASHKMTLEDF